jgi:hypothetical protein
MSLVLSDRVKETSTTSGTGTIVLGGAVGGFVSFSSGVGEGNKTYYVIENDTRWEIGIGTFSSGSLSRDTVLSSSGGGSKADLSGLSFVFVALPASKTVIKGEGDFDLEADLVTADNITVKKYALLNNVASSGEIISSGFLTLSRTNAGNFFHAYVDDSNDKTISLYSDASSAPEWKLGLKADPSNQTDPPTYAYIHGEDGNIGLYANSLNTLSLSHGAGFTLTNKGSTIITSASTTGTVVNAQAAAYPVLTLKGATSHSANLQEWQSVIGTVLSSVSSDGSLTVKGSDVLSSIDANTVSGVAISGWAEAYVDAQDHSATSVSGSLQPQITQNAEDIVTVSGLTSAGVDALPHVSGEYFLQLIDDNSVSGVAMSGYTNDAVSSGISASGNANRDFTVDVSGALQPQITQYTDQILANSASGYVISGVAIDASGWNKHFTEQLDRLPHASGYYFLQLIDDNSASGTSNLDANLSTSGYFDQVLGSGSYLGIIPTAVSGYIDYALGSGVGDIRVNSASGVAISGYFDQVLGSGSFLGAIPTAVSGYIDYALGSGVGDIRVNSASGVAISGYFDQVLGSGSFLGAIPTAVSGYIDYALGSGIGDVRINSASGVAISGYFDQVLGSGSFLGAIPTAVSGYIDYALGSGIGDIRINSASGVVISGIAEAVMASGQKAKENYDYGFVTSGVHLTQNVGYTDPLSGVISSSGIRTSGVVLGNNVPPNTHWALYNDGGTLKFNGSALGGGGDGSAADILANSASGVVISGIAEAVMTSGQVITANTTALNASGQKNKDNYDYGFATSGITYANGVDNRIATFTDTNALNGEANLTFDGSTLTYIGYLGSGLAIANDGGVTASGNVIASGSMTIGGDITTSGNVITSGVSTSGVHLQPIAPALSGYPTTNVLYNDNGTLKFNGSAVGGGGSSRSVSGDTDNGIITWKTSDDTFIAESALTFDGSTLKIITGDTRFSVTNEGYVFASGDVTSSGTVISSGVSTTGVHLPPIAATALHSSGNHLFQEDGMLKFAGHILTSGAATHSDTTYTAGDGLTLTSTDFDLDAALTTVTSIYNSSLAIGHSASDANINFGTDNNIVFDIDGNAQIKLQDGVLTPETDSDVDLGTSSVRFKDAYIDTVTTTNDITSSGTVISSGVSTSGVHLQPIAAAALHSTTHQLYHETGILKFNGQILTSGAATPDLIDHDALTNFVANEHVDHTSVTLTAGDGLTGGGTIAANRTFAVSVDDSTIEIDSDSLRVKDNGITLAKMAGITRGSIIIGDSSGDPVALAISTNDGYVLTSDGTDIAWEAAAGGGDITSVVAGAGMTGGATTGDATVNVIGGNGITANANDVAITAAQTTVTSMYNASLKMGRDAQNLIDFATTDNKIILRVNNVDEVELVENALSPVTSDGVALGTTSLQWSDLFLAEGSVINWDNGDVTLTQTNNSLALAGGNFVIPDAGTIGSASVPAAITISSAGAVTFANSINQAHEAVSLSSNTATFNCALSNYFEVAVNAQVNSILFTNATAGQRIVILATESAGAANMSEANGWDTITINTNSGGDVEWAGGTEPTLAANTKDMYGIIFSSNVLNAYGFIIGQDLKD